ncbi:MAG: T9SS type A sorting domain-containing protein [Bacteroidia bacterium]
MKNSILYLLFSLITFLSCAQKRNYIWCFGDSSGIDFNNLNNPVPINTSFDTRGSCVSIADSSGQILFYANTRATLAGNTTLVWNKNNFIMQNGDSIVGRGWYNELVIISDPGNDSVYYLFSIGVTSIYGVYYSIVDLRQNNGLGEVTLKNIQLETYKALDCLNAIRHANGRDWWIITRDYENPGNIFNNMYYLYLVTPSGVSSAYIQNVGFAKTSGFGKIAFSKDGSKMAFINYKRLVELYDFDRCSGAITLTNTIEAEKNLPPWPAYWSCEFSHNGQRLYISTNSNTTYLLQYDLTASNIFASKDTLWSLTYPTIAGGALKRGPDDKIYLSCAYNDGVNFNYPYPDSVYNMYNMNLGVINFPNNLGTACDFQPYSFYLGGKRTYWGLPNNPDYEMGAVSGSICDSLTGIPDIFQNVSNAELFVFYHPGWQKAFVNAQNLKGRIYSFVVYDILSNVIYKKEGKLNSKYFTQDLNTTNYSKGLYIIAFQTEKEKLVKRFVKD